SGGSPAGGQYFINGQLNSTFAPSQFSQGSQTISYQLSNACGTDSVSASISVLSAPTAFAGNDTVINSGDIVSLNGVGISTSGSSIASWSPASLVLQPNVFSSQSIAISTTTDFILSVSQTGNQCFDADTMTATVIN